MQTTYKPRAELFRNYTLDECISIVEQTLPNGEFWQVKNVKESSLYKLIHAMASVWHEKLNNIALLWKEFDPVQTENLISKWETFVGIPDDTTPIASTLVERRANVISRIITRKLITLQDYIDVVTVLGLPYKAVYHNGTSANSDSDGFPYVFDIWLISDIELKFTVTWELFAGEPTNALFQALLNKIKPRGIEFYYVEV